MSNAWRAVTVGVNSTKGNATFNATFGGAAAASLSTDLGNAKGKMLLIVCQDTTAKIQGKQNTVFNALKKAYNCYKDNLFVLSTDVSDNYKRFNGAKVSLVNGDALKPELFNSSNKLVVGDFTEPCVMVLVGNEFYLDAANPQTSLDSALASTVPGSGATFNLTASGGAVSAAAIVAAGTGYRVGQKLYVTGGSGTGCVLTVATITAATGAILTATVTTAGTGYANSESALSVLVGSAATFDATTVDGSGGITAVSINAAGSKYTAGDTLTLALGAAPATSACTLTVSTVNGTGGITAVTVADGGLGYDGHVNSVNGRSLRFEACFEEGMKKLRESFKAY